MNISWSYYDDGINSTSNLSLDYYITDDDASEDLIDAENASPSFLSRLFTPAGLIEVLTTRLVPLVFGIIVIVGE